MSAAMQLATPLEMSREQWERIGELFLEIAGKIVAVFSSFADHFRRAFDAAFNDPATKAAIAHLLDRTRYAPGQRKPKPRGRRAKQEAAAAWRAHVDMLRMRRGES